MKYIPNPLSNFDNYEIRNEKYVWEVTLYNTEGFIGLRWVNEGFNIVRTKLGSLNEICHIVSKWTDKISKNKGEFENQLKYIKSWTNCFLQTKSIEHYNMICEDCKKLENWLNA